MHTSFFATGLAAAAALAGFCLTPAPQDPKQDPSVDMQAMMKKAEKFTKPGPHHEHLRRFLGKWNTELRFVMGGKTSPA